VAKEAKPFLVTVREKTGGIRGSSFWAVFPTITKTISRLPKYIDYLKLLPKPIYKKQKLILAPGSFYSASPRSPDSHLPMTSENQWHAGALYIYQGIHGKYLYSTRSSIKALRLQDYSKPAFSQTKIYIQFTSRLL